MQKGLEGKIALFSMHADNPRIKEHCEKGGIAAVIENGDLIVYTGKWKTIIDKITNIPLSLNGRAEAMIKNILPATLAALIQNIKIEDIRNSLKTFIPSGEQTPGRMNIFNFKNFKVMIDYVHNEDGFNQLKKFMDYVEASVKVVLVSVPGDRLDEDIKNNGRLCAQMFDELIIKHDSHLRGRTKDELTLLIKEGIYSVKQMPIKVISDETEAIVYALENAKNNSFITICADKVFDTIKIVKQAQEKELSKVQEYKQELQIQL
jgi:cyanophycin synthetase